MMARTALFLSLSILWASLSAAVQPDGRAMALKLLWREVGRLNSGVAARELNVISVDSTQAGELEITYEIVSDDHRYVEASARSTLMARGKWIRSPNGGDFQLVEVVPLSQKYRFANGSLVEI